MIKKNELKMLHKVIIPAMTYFILKFNDHYKNSYITIITIIIFNFFLLKHDNNTLSDKNVYQI